MNQSYDDHTLYYDQEFNEYDGMGWNLIDNYEGLVALRFCTLDKALSWWDNNYPNRFGLTINGMIR